MNIIITAFGILAITSVEAWKPPNTDIPLVEVITFVPQIITYNATSQATTTPNSDKFKTKVQNNHFVSPPPSP